ncbi:GAF domain-containing protein [Oceanotoga sp. DSM 15011]|jgi:GAF domain-containing protein|uniref:GAF domain-containing protein n=1 Tax=Oceanotoga TaxID=1255275 RepID=UPI0021F4A466|nr:MULTISPECIES: GAF domain-containing protein [Oceanotoga]MDN5341834.1 L-methionine (R)-S-oxide reductase [Oceanotoga sp.]MDO7976685.1 GAF domain-containing protein [Oceanotoga teriensis]UYP00667.1 GAF domain-containing protein [Oceanotoga sp. DSM 15011]
MRSVFKDKTNTFFEILTYNLFDWDKAWQKYKENNYEIINYYQNKNKINDIEASEKLKKMGRRYLDKAFWFREPIINEIKSNIINMITQNTEKFELNRADYTIEILGLFGEKPHQFIETYKGNIIVIDFMYFYNHKDEITLEEIIKNAINDYLKNIKYDEKRKIFWVLIDNIKKIINDNPKNMKNAMEKICKIIDKKLDYYNWIGFYMVGKQKDILELGPYIGEPTEHLNIKFGEGICGQAASTEKTFIISDVSKEKNYLSCSEKTKSEIVVPIFNKKGKVVGEIDIDSHKISPFDEKDKQFLEEVSDMIKKQYF